MRLEVFDFETINVKGKLLPYCLAYTDNDRVKLHYFTDLTPLEASLYILDNFKPGVVYYAHNLVFDFLLFFRGLLHMGVKYKWFYANYSLYEVIVHYKSKDYIFRCSYKLMPFRLEDFYPRITSRNKMYFPYEALKSWSPESTCSSYKNIPSEYFNWSLKAYLGEYAKNDCLMLKEALVNFFESLRGVGIPFNKRALTCGSIAMAFFIKEYNTIKLDLDKSLCSVLRNAYYGGRCEVFGNARDHEKVLHFDFKGMYQQCMLEVLPSGGFKYSSDCEDISKPGFYCISLDACADIPVLPQRKDKLYFLDGNLTGWYWHEEIKLALEVSNVRSFKIVHALLSEENTPALKDFIQRLSIIREKGLILKDLGKLLINSFYGRLGLDDEFNLIELNLASDTLDEYGEFGDLFLSKRKVKSAAKTNVAVAAAITAKARIKLYRAFQEVQRAGGRILYCDTDSVFAAFDKNADVTGRMLGNYVNFDTTKADTILRDSVFILPKTYGIVLKDNAHIIKIKGVSVKELNVTDLKKAFYERRGSITLSSEHILTKDVKVTQVFQTKEVRLDSYDKRLWGADLKSTSALKW